MVKKRINVWTARQKSGRCTKVAVVERSWAPNENIVQN